MIPLPLSPLQLRQHCFTHISIRVNPSGLAHGKVSLEPLVSFQNDPENANQWLLTLRVLMKSIDTQTPFIYETDVAIQGIVEVQGDYPAEKREQLAAVNGLSLLYSAVREMILIMTARSFHGLMCLPTLSFIEVVANKKAQEQTPEKSPGLAQPAIPSGQK
jgi:preprotein translocase subunit SecB